MKAVFSIKIEKSLIQKIKDFCQMHGLKQGFFVESALRRELEAEELKEDIVELKELRSQEGLSMPFDEYLKKRRA